MDTLPLLLIILCSTLPPGLNYFEIKEEKSMEKVHLVIAGDSAGRLAFTQPVYKAFIEEHFPFKVSRAVIVVGSP